MPPVKFWSCCSSRIPTLEREHHQGHKWIDYVFPFVLDSRNTTVGTSHKAQTIGTTRHLCALRPLVNSASYRPGRVTTNQDMNFLCSHSHEARVGPIDSSDDWFPMQPSRLGSGLEAFSHNPYGGSITALSDRTTVDTRDHTWEFLSYYPRLL